MTLEESRRILGRGTLKGLTTSWELIKVIAPTYLVVTALKHTPVLAWLTGVCEPFMGWFGLSGEAAVVLVFGNATGLYAALGAMASLEFTPKETATLALMLSFSHNLLVETAVTKRLGVSFWAVLAYRVLLAAAAGVLMNQLPWF